MARRGASLLRATVLRTLAFHQKTSLNSHCFHPFHLQLASDTHPQSPHPSPSPTAPSGAPPPRFTPSKMRRKALVFVAVVAMLLAASAAVAR